MPGNHQYQVGSFAPKGLDRHRHLVPWPNDDLTALEKETSVSPYTRVPIAIKNMKQVMAQPQCTAEEGVTMLGIPEQSLRSDLHIPIDVPLSAVNVSLHS
jgi:hypothetical protein